MKKFFFKEMYLLSHKEKRARHLSLSKGLNIIKGKNDYGKSAVIKCFYSILGATVDYATFPWYADGLQGIIVFELSGEDYYFLNAYGRCALFSAQKELIKTFRGTQENLANFFKDNIGCNILLETRDTNLEPAFPSALFSPFYVDQDIGWVMPWKSFTGLSYFKNWKNDIIDSYTGVRPFSYVEAKHKFSSLKNNLKDLQKQSKSLNTTITQIKESFSDIHSEITVMNFRQDLKQLRDEFEKLSLLQNNVKKQIAEIGNQKIELEIQLKAAQVAQKEVNDDYQFALEHDNVIECTMCGAKYENGISDVFKLACFEDHCTHIISQCLQKLDDCNIKLQKLQEQDSTITKSLEKIQTTLDEQKGKFKLKDIILDLGRKKISEIIDLQADDVRKKLNETNSLFVEAQRIYQGENDLRASRSQRIREEYVKYMSSFLPELGVLTVSNKSYKSIYSNINTGGSIRPRVLLAYYFSLINLICQFAETSNVIFPFIIDSPKQQDMDEDNWVKELDFIIKHQPEDTQMIIGLVDEGNFALPNANIITFEKKYHGLLDSEYESLRPIFDELVKIMQSDFSDLPLFNP